MLLLIYLILTAQRSKRNMEWKLLRSFFFPPLTQFTYLFIPLSCPLSPTLCIQGTTRQQENTATHRFLHSSTQHWASIDVSIRVGLLCSNRQAALWMSSQKQEKEKKPVCERTSQLNLCFSRTANVRLLFSLSVPACSSASCTHPHTVRYQSNLSQIITCGSTVVKAKKKVCRETEEAIYLSKTTHLIQ